MPTDVRGTIVAPFLSNVSIRYKNQSYIADQVFPVLNGVDPKAKVGRYTKGAWFRDEAAVRSAAAEAVRGGLVTDFVSLNTAEYAFASPVTDEDRRYANAAGAMPIKPDIDAMELCADKIDLHKERLIANQILGGTWSGLPGGETAAGLWAPNDATNTFITDILDRIETIRSNTGFTPNSLILDFGTYNALRKNDALLNRIRYTQRGILSSDLIAAMFDLNNVFVAKAIYSTARELKSGTDFTASNIWEKNAGKGSAFLYYRPPSVGLKTPTVGIQYRLQYPGAGTRRAIAWREAARHQDVYEVAEETAIALAGPDLGFLWYNTLVA